MSTLAEANPPRARKENAEGKAQQLRGRKERTADIIDPPVLTASLDGFMGFASLLDSTTLSLWPRSPAHPDVAHWSRRPVGASRNLAQPALCPTGSLHCTKDKHPKLSVKCRALFAIAAR